MIVKVSLDKEMSEWLASISTEECRSNAQQVLYWLKKIRAGQYENLLGQNVPIKNVEATDRSKEDEDSCKVDECSMQPKQQIDEQEQINLYKMLEFL